MITGFENYLRSHTPLTGEEIGKITATARRGLLQRNEKLLQQGQICRHKTFIVTGLLRTYGIADDGREAILQFSPENTWILDAESYDKQVPSRFNIAAVEKSEVLMWTKDEYDTLLEELPVLRQLSQQLISRSGHNNRQRLFTVLSASPEEKYDNFIHQYPDLLSRLPLHMIAAYLGISLKTLTRIRHSRLPR